MAACACIHGQCFLKGDEMIAPMRRVTVNVPSGRMEEVMAFYRDVFGMHVFFETVFQTKNGQGGEAMLLGLNFDITNRIVSLQQGNTAAGMVGLHEFIEPPIDVKPFEKREGQPYPVVFIFSVENIEALHERVLKAGAKVISPPYPWEIPGKGMAKGMHFLDPIGVNIEFTEYLSDVEHPTPSVSPVRRVTIPVARGRLGESKRFYEEVMGMRVFYESDLEPDPGLGAGDFPNHLASMQQGDSVAGMVGLIEYGHPEMDIKPFSRTPEGLFPVAFIFLTDDVEADFARAKAFGAPVVCPPVSYDIPQRGISVGTTFIDPNGVLVSLTQLSKQP